jgi:hypothetical protein
MTDTDPTHQARPRRSPGVLAASITRYIAALYIFFALVEIIVTIVQTFDSNSTVQVAMPVETFWPQLPKGTQLDGVSAHVVGGGFSTATVDLTGLDVAARVWLALDSVLQAATGVVIAIAIVLLCTSILRNNPFQRAVQRSIVMSAITVIIGGLAWQISGAIGGGLASEQTLRSTGFSIPNDVVTINDLTHIIGIPGPSAWGTSVNLWPVGVGLALLAIAAVFRRGILLQKDTEGLV